MKPPRPTVMNLREFYSEPGEYEFKVILDPKHYANAHAAKLCVLDAGGRPVRSTARAWGTKLVCRFEIDERTTEGCAAAHLTLQTSAGEEVQRMLTFYVIQ